jgi:hypothetical protein
VEDVARAFQVNEADNVATLLDDVSLGRVNVHGCGGLVVNAVDQISLGHKIALRAIARGAAVIKYGVSIGIASAEISAGQWVHLHNCHSAVDERSNHLDLKTGVATDTPYV